MTVTDDFTNPFASGDDAETTSAETTSAETTDAGEHAAALVDAPADASEVTETIEPADEVTLPGDAEILEVTELDAPDDEVVEAEPSPYDRRSLRVKATAAGVKLQAQLDEVFEHQAEELTNTTLKPEDLVDLERTLRSVEQFWARTAGQG